jgi:hypothetical protein
MKNNRNRHRQTRGWYPNDPTLFITSKATHSRKLEKWIANPFLTMGALTIICSLISAVFGAVFVSAYLTGYVTPPPDAINARILYSGLFAGIFSLAAFALGLYSGILLLARKHTSRVAASMAIILVCAVGTVLAPIIEQIDPPLCGVPIAAPMIISSVATLCIVGLNMNSQRTGLANQQPPTRPQRLFAGLGAAGGVFIGIGLFFYFVPIFPKSMALSTSLIVGIPLLVAAFIVKAKNRVKVAQ